MKYLIKYPKRFALAMAAVIMNLINIIRAIRTGEVTEEMIVAFLLAVFTLLGLYFNIPTSEKGVEGLEHMKYLDSIEKKEDDTDVD